MRGLGALIKRNCKLFFKDKGMFFTSLITPMILLVLYATFLWNVYEDGFASAMPQGFSVDEALHQRYCRRTAYLISSRGVLCDRRVLLQSSDGAG